MSAPLSSFFSRNLFSQAGPRLVLGFVTVAAALLLSVPSTRAANIAAPGAGILGVKSAVDGTLGTLRFNAGTATNIIDGSFSTRVDNFFGGNTQAVSFVGVIWPVKHYEAITNIAFTVATFGDGGWFGVPGALPPTGGALAATNLIEPLVQVTTNLGTNWITIGSTSDYQTVMLGHQIGGTGGQPNPSTNVARFTFSTPVTRINGIRLIGTNGGRAGADTNGFLGVIDFAVNAEPLVDGDSDGLADAWETEYGVTDPAVDSDGDGLTNLQEFTIDTNPIVADTDGDTLTDAFEFNTSKTNPQLADTDGDGLSDSAELNTHNTNPLLGDTDGDGLLDGAEVNTHTTNPLVRDTDGDGYADGFEVAQGTSPTNADVFPDNLALLGFGIMGVFDNVTNGINIPYTQQGLTPAVLGRINDENLTTRVDTFNGASLVSTSYVGILWTNRPLAPNQKVAVLELTMAFYGDGGWFGVNNNGPGAGGILTSNTHLVEPSIEVTTDGGATWTTVPHTSTYMALHGVRIGGGTYPNPQNATARFTLDSQPMGINGIRIIGQEGGTASRGFIGVSDLAIRIDSDNDGIGDGYERANGLIVGTDDSADDPDFDNVTNLDEFRFGTRAQLFDTDGDGLPDGDELTVYFTRPFLADSDLDGLSDGAEINTAGTDPLVFDSDGDGLSDGAEVNTYRTNPLSGDTDGDGFSDAGEVGQGTDPNNALNFPNNLASFTTAIGILGTTNASGLDTQRYNSGAQNNIRDNNLTTRVDNFGHPATDSNSFVGILWSRPITNVPIVSLELTLAVFYDGGWFGSNNVAPPEGGILTSNTHLVAPIVQLTTDYGTNWFTVAQTNDYLSLMEGKRTGNRATINPTNYTIKFFLAQPATNVNGVRIVGPHGGVVSSSGFLGVFELRVRTTFDDTDNDGMDDAYERLNGLNVGVNDAGLDPDGDGLTNIQEFTRGTNPQAADSDGDGLSDSVEVNTSRTNPLASDSDADGLTDGAEFITYRTNPTLRDTDGDGLSDGTEVSQGSDPLSAASVPANLALTATGILGVSPSVDAVGTLRFNSGAGANINDGNIGTRVDTFGVTDSNAFVGLLWTQPVTNLSRLKLSFAVFFDGGWFGPANIGPGTGGHLAPQYLLEPIVQVTTNGGTSWMTVPATSDYLTAMNNAPLPTVDFGAPTTNTVSFELTPPQTGINGVRIIGSEGGTASGGFLGVFELEARTPIGGAVTLINVTQSAGQIRFQFDSMPFSNHVVQYKNSLNDATWQTLTTIAGDGTRKTVTDTTVNASRFYRVTTE